MAGANRQVVEKLSRILAMAVTLSRLSRYAAPLPPSNVHRVNASRLNAEIEAGDPSAAKDFAVEVEQQFLEA
jgi:hypothetical protein